MTLNNIDTQLITTRKQIQEICKDLKSEHVMNFKQNISNEEIVKLKPDLNLVNGIYYFEMKVDKTQNYEIWRSNFEREWDTFPKDMKHTPTSKIKR